MVRAAEAALQGVLGGPTLVSSALWQAQSVLLDVRDRVKSRKRHAALRELLGQHELP